VSLENHLSEATVATKAQSHAKLSFCLEQSSTLSRTTPSLWMRLARRAIIVERAIFAFLKRLTDVLVSGIMLLALAVPMAILAVIIKLYDRGPVLFWQQRVGKHGRIFGFPKFRSMRVDAEQLKDKLLAANQYGNTAINFKMKGDPRITPIGRFIRRFSADELPQLWCVLIGDMSLVGPRPPVPREVVNYSSADRRRLEVTPGLTCIWQVSGRSNVPFPQQVEMDCEYIHRQSLTKDIELLAKTVPAVLTGRGAY
jgi:lipopolysaccharide/colanic/teichoic acid biosynthesis glycosyltransferase